MPPQLPKHIVIIPDGNRRWAEKKGLPSFKGHEAGSKRAQLLFESAYKFGIHTLTFWGFSTENWNRSKVEISFLMNLFEEYADKTINMAKQNNARIFHLGRKDRLPKSLIKKLSNAEEETKRYAEHVANIALDYGGQDEILRGIDRAKIDAFQKPFPDYLDTALQPYPNPDLIIRTSGEQRTSGILQWQSTYAELYFETVDFPDFTDERLKKIIEWFGTRERRYGGDAGKTK